MASDSTMIMPTLFFMSKPVLIALEAKYLYGGWYLDYLMLFYFLRTMNDARRAPARIFKARCFTMLRP